MAQDAADVLIASDVGCSHAVLDAVARAFREAHEGGGVLLAGGDGARHGQVLDGRTVYVAEQSRTLVVVGNSGCDGVAVAVEGAAEGVDLRTARHGTALCRHADVVGQLYKLATESFAVADCIDEGVPVVSAVDEVWVILRACARQL